MSCAQQHHYQCRGTAAGCTMRQRCALQKKLCLYVRGEFLIPGIPPVLFILFFFSMDDLNPAPQYFSTSNELRQLFRLKAAVGRAVAKKPKTLFHFSSRLNRERLSDYGHAYCALVWVGKGKYILGSTFLEGRHIIHELLYSAHLSTEYKKNLTTGLVM